MEQYSIDGRGRGGTYVTLALVALALSYGTHQAIDLVPRVAMPWWIEIPSFAVFFGLVNLFFDRVLWRVRLFGVGFSQIPDFSGTWTGAIDAADRDEHHTRLDVTVRIRQSWSTIDIVGKTARGTTHSKMVGIRIADEDLRYEYETRGTLFNKSARDHVGYAVLSLIEENVLDGYFYTLDGSSAKGAMSLQRVDPRESAPRNRRQEDRIEQQARRANPDDTITAEKLG